MSSLAERVEGLVAKWPHQAELVRPAQGLVETDDGVVFDAGYHVCSIDCRRCQIEKLLAAALAAEGPDGATRLNLEEVRQALTLCPGYLGAFSNADFNFVTEYLNGLLISPEARTAACDCHDCMYHGAIFRQWEYMQKASETPMEMGTLTAAPSLHKEAHAERFRRLFGSDLTGSPQDAAFIEDVSEIYNDGFEMAHELMRCGHSRGDFRDPGYIPGKPETYTASESCIGCEREAELRGIIKGLEDVIAGRTKPLEQISAELAALHKEGAGGAPDDALLRETADIISFIMDDWCPPSFPWVLPVLRSQFAATGPAGRAEQEQK